MLKVNRDQLREITQQKEQILSSIRQLEQARLSRLNDLIGDQALDALTDWLRRHQVPESKKVQAALNRLVSISELKVKQQSEKNATLIFRGLYVVREALSLMYTGLGTQPVYGDSGQLTFPSVATSLNFKG